MIKEWGVINNLDPILYAPANGTIANFINHVIGVDDKEMHQDGKKLYDEVTDHFDRILGVTKPLSGLMLIGGKPVEKDFYQENEWRFVPKGYELLDQSEFTDERAARDASLEKHPLKFSPADVKYIFVKSDAEIPIIFDFIQNHLGHWPLNEIKILSSRITSLETLSHDL